MEDQVGQVFQGLYLVERALAPGRMGIVYQAVDQMLGIKVAVKRMVCPTDRTHLWPDVHDPSVHIDDHRHTATVENESVTLG